MDPIELQEDENREQRGPGSGQRLSETMNAVFDHRCFRYTPVQGWTQIWVYMHGLGKGAFLLISALLVITTPLFLVVLHKRSWLEKLLAIIEFGFWILAPCLIAWLLGYLALKLMPERYLLRPSPKGPVWDMNRQTGMVTIFARKKGQFRKLGIEGDFTAPFYEFDAAIHTIPDRQGFPQHMLNLIHRYEGLGIDFSVLMGKVSRQQPCMALWVFCQRYMDVRQPTPDLPELEVFRHLDPTTAEHDRLTARPERYWRDMDVATFRANINAITDVTKVNMDRPNIMAKYVSHTSN